VELHTDPQTPALLRLGPRVRCAELEVVGHRVLGCVAGSRAVGLRGAVLSAASHDECECGKRAEGRANAHGCLLAVPGCALGILPHARARGRVSISIGSVIMAMPSPLPP